MPDRKASSTSNSSRTAAKIAVAVLIVIAIAGFVLAGLKAGKPAAEQAAAADPTQEPAAAPTAAAAAAPVAAASADEPPVAPHIVVFVPSSAKLADKELAKVRDMADAAKKKNREIQIVSTVEPAQFGLAQQRATLVRQTLEQGGVPLGRMSIKVSTVPQGTVSATEANRVEMVLR